MRTGFFIGVEDAHKPLWTWCDGSWQPTSPERQENLRGAAPEPQSLATRQRSWEVSPPTLLQRAKWRQEFKANLKTLDKHNANRTNDTLMEWCWHPTTSVFFQSPGQAYTFARSLIPGKEQGHLIAAKATVSHQNLTCRFIWNYSLELKSLKIT